MKKITFYLMALCLTLAFIPLQSNAEPTVTPSALADPVPAETTILLLRLDEIKAMDISVLKASEKRELRKEVKSIKEQLKGPQYVYLSVGAIIAIVLILILLL